MLAIRHGAERGATDLGWLKSRHTFSFGGYHEPEFMGYRSLRVLNDDLVAPSGGFGTHPHRDMEIISFVIDGALEHKDSMDNGSVLRAWDVQRMTAGSGVRHSEFNPSSREGTRFIQVWIEPDRKGLTPGYEEGSFPRAARVNELVLVVSPDGRDGSLRVHQDARIFLGAIEEGRTLEAPVDPARHQWVQVVTGAVGIDGARLEAGDGIALHDVSRIEIVGEREADFILFDLA